MGLLQMESRGGAGFILMMAAAALYVACRGAIDAVARPDGSDPGRRALAQWLPVAITSLTAVCLHRPEIAVTLIFSTSVAALSLAVGFSAYLAPMKRIPPRGRAWSFLLPAALLTFVGGLTGRLTFIHAAMLLIMGTTILSVWLARPAAASVIATPADSASGQWNIARFAQLLLAIGLAVLGAWGAVRGTVMVTAQSWQLTTSIVTASVLSPLLVLPMIGSSATVAQQDDSGSAISALMGTVLLNLCVLLPLTILLNGALSIPSAALHGATAQAIVGQLTAHIQPLPFPVSVWRVENIILLILGLLYLPVAFGRWLLGRPEAAMLILGYAIYLAFVALASRSPQ